VVGTEDVVSARDVEIIRRLGPHDLTDDEAEDLAMLLDHWRDQPVTLLVQTFRLGRERAFVKRGAKVLGSAEPTEGAA
jgi:hypothetical protein